MRKLWCLLLFIVVGCNHGTRFLDCSTCNKEVIDCPNGSANCGPTHGSSGTCVVEAPCPKPACEVRQAPQRCEQSPEIEIRAPKPIHLKIPPQQFIIQNEGQPQTMPTGQQQSFAPQSFAPQSFAPQSFAPQPMVAQQMMMMPVMQPQSAGPAGRARLGMTFDTFRIPIPFLRFIAVPEAPQPMQAVAMVAPQSFAPQSFVQQSFAPQSFAPQSFAPQSFAQQSFAPQSFAPQSFAPQSFAQQSFAPQSFAQQSFAPQSFTPQSAPAQQQHVMVPVPGTVDVPVQSMVKVPGTMDVPVQSMVKVPYQAHMPVPVQPQGFAPQSAAVQSQGMIPVVPQGTNFQPQSFTQPQPQMQGISLQQAEEFCRLVEQMKRQMNQNK